MVVGGQAAGGSPLSARPIPLSSGESQGLSPESPHLGNWTVRTVAQGSQEHKKGNLLSLSRSWAGELAPHHFH